MKLEQLEPQIDRGGPGELTSLLQRWSEGDRVARDRFFERVHPDLRALARHRLRGEGPVVTLQATELAHEAFLRLESQKQVGWENRTQFFALAALLIRRILVDHARKRLRSKRGGGVVHLAVDENSLAVDGMSLEILDVDRALQELAAIRPTTARIVELKFFAGLENEEIGPYVGMSGATVKRRWRFARAWLAKTLRPPDDR